MWQRLRIACIGWIAVIALAPLGSAQLNELQLCNGGDGLFTYSDPSVGFATGVFPPDIAGGDWVWKVFPAPTLRVADGGFPPHLIEVTGIQVALYDTDWGTGPSFYDLIFTTGIPTGLPDGNIGPDFASPSLVFLSLGAAAAFGIVNPCLVAPPLGCIGPCPPAGLVAGYSVEFTFFGGPGPTGGML